MDSVLNYSEVSVAVRFDREVYSSKRIDHPNINSEIKMDCTYWIGEGGVGTNTEVDHTSLTWIDNTDEYMITTNAEDIATFDDYEEAKAEIIDRLTTKFRERLQEALNID